MLKSLPFLVSLAAAVVPMGIATASTAFTGMRAIPSRQIVDEMRVGWNLGNTLDASRSETNWGNPLTTKAMITTVKRQGFNVIRIPVTWFYHAGGAPDHIIQKAWMDRVEEVVNYALDNDMYVLLNTHHEEGWLMPTYARQAANTDQLVKYWTQIAERFKAYGDYLIFEPLNEPRLHGTPQEWGGGTPEGRDVINKLQLAAVNAIRATGGNNAVRHLLVCGYAANRAAEALEGLVIPNDDPRIIVSIHSYSPSSFCQAIPGATTWGTAADKAALDVEFDRMANLFVKKGRAVILGEWGSKHKDNAEARAVHAEYFVKAAKSRGITPVVWDDGGQFLQLDRRANVWRYPVITDAIIKAAGTTPISIGIRTPGPFSGYAAGGNPPIMEKEAGRSQGVVRADGRTILTQPLFGKNFFPRRLVRPARGSVAGPMEYLLP